METNKEIKIINEDKDDLENGQSMLSSFFNRTKLFINKNKIELGLLFVIIFTIILSTDLKNKSNFCLKTTGGAAAVTTKTTTTTVSKQQPKIQSSIQQQQSMTTSSMTQRLPQQSAAQAQTYQIKSKLTSLAYGKFGAIIMNSPTVINILCYISSFIKSLLMLGSVVLIVMLIPGIPVFGFMLLLFVILRGKLANIKAL